MTSLGGAGIDGWNTYRACYEEESENRNTRKRKAIGGEDGAHIAGVAGIYMSTEKK
jgi:hypothetical protein